jgi:hypothetical protein
MSAPSSRPPAPVVAPRRPAADCAVRCQEVRSVYDYMPATLLGYLAGIGVICMLFWADAPAATIVPWLATCRDVARAGCGGAFAAPTSARWTTGGAGGSLERRHAGVGAQ